MDLELIPKGDVLLQVRVHFFATLRQKLHESSKVKLWTEYWNSDLITDILSSVGLEDEEVVVIYRIYSGYCVYMNSSIALNRHP